MSDPLCRDGRGGPLGRFLAVTLSCALLAGCHSAPAKRGAAPKYVDPPSGAALSDREGIKDGLYRQYREWRGVRYRNGGLSREGVDCSGFVFVTYRDRFGIILPRSTKEQAGTGKRIKQKKLRPGDLVFFKTGFSTRHVGIYVGQRTFLHVSEKKGVTMTSLDNRYWSRRYWQSRRVGPG
jgi:cell wall-associated NlpC family hydrolase